MLDPKDLKGIARAIDSHTEGKLGVLRGEFSELAAAFAEKVAALEARLAAIEDNGEKAHGNSTTYHGTWSDGAQYSRGALITHRGALWFCRSDSTYDAPGTSDAWQLTHKSFDEGRVKVLIEKELRRRRNNSAETETTA